MFSVFHILVPYVDTSGINCNMNRLSERFSSYVSFRSVELYGSVCTKYVKIYLELYFIHISCLYICMYTLCVYLSPVHMTLIGRAARLSEVVQSVLGTFCVRSYCGLL